MGLHLEILGATMAKLRVGDREYNVREESFQVIREEWNEYAVSEDGRLRVKTTVRKIFRVLDEDGTPAFTADGDPHMIVRHGTDIVTSH